MEPYPKDWKIAIVHSTYENEEKWGSLILPE
jgi:hypothetical protein